MEVEKGFMETELRLGLPGNNNNNNEAKKRGFSETVDLKLNIQEPQMDHNHNHKIPFTAVDPAKPPAAKAQVVGWPPVRSYRKNMVAVKKSSNESESSDKAISFVKVSMDGAPYLRKVDLIMFNSYKQLSDALTNMFSSFTTINGNCGSQLNESKLVDVLNTTDYVPTYEDKDGDWMLVGDVPWEMFVESCKRLRIMKGTEATGLAPRAMEKRKNKS